MNTEFAWDRNSLSQEYTLSKVPHLIDKDMVRELVKIKNGKAAALSVGEARIEVRVISRANCFHKTGGHPKIWTCKKFSKSRNNWKDSTCSKQLKLIENKRNKPTYGSANKSLFIQTKTADH